MQKQTRHVGKTEEKFSENMKDRWNENEKKKEQMKQLPPETGEKVHFELMSAPGSHVFVAGIFNNWNPTATPLMDTSGKGHYKAVLHLPGGAHEYKFIVDGTWTVDMNCADCVPNAHGSMNSVLHV